MKPVVDGLKQEYEGKVEFRLIDADNDPKAASLGLKYGISAVPTFVFLNSDGKEASRLLGEQPVKLMREQLDALK
ncbi:MAG: thioredoxin domain-containing protein [Actinomycetota bacterium]|nr:thioredoxin domain-containing protein [Actinomycetota bacterium]